MAKLLAIASNTNEAKHLLAFAKERMQERDNCLLLILERVERKRDAEKDIKTKFATVVEQANYLSKADKNLVGKKAIYFTRNWYKFDKTFEDALNFSGISMGFLSEKGIRTFFYNTLEQLKAVKNAVKKEKPDIVLTGRNSIAGKIVKAVGKKEKLPKVKFIDFETEKSYRHWTSFTTTKARQITENTKNLLKDAFGKIGKNKKKHLVFFRGRGHYTKGVKQALSNEKDLDIYSLDEFLLKRFLKPKNMFGFISLKKKLVVKFKKVVQAYETSNGFAKKMQFDGIPFTELFHWKISLFVEKFWPEFAFTIQELRSLFESKRPDALILWSDVVSFERICALIAHEKKIPSFVIQHGIFEDENLEDDWLAAFIPLIVDYIAVWGPVFKRILIKKKVSSKRIAVIGIPRADFLAEKKFNGKKFKKKIGVKENEKLVVMTYGSGQNGMPKISRDIDNALHKFPNTRFVLKVHPAEVKKKYVDLMQGIDKKAIVLDKENIYELLDSSEAVITMDSTTGLEAMIMGKPVIIFPNEDEDFSMYRNTNAVLRASNQKELEKALECILLGKEKKLEKLKKNMQKFVFDYGFKQDGKASQRLVKLVKKTIKQAKKKQIQQFNYEHDKKTGKRLATLNDKKPNRKTVLAIIAARGNSKRIKGKNIRELDGKPLIAYTIEAALKSKRLDNVIVSTDSEKIAEISKGFGASVPFIRPKEIATDTSSSFDATRHAVNEFEKKSKKKVDCIVLLQPTSPFRNEKHIDKAIEKFFKEKANSLFSVSKASKKPDFHVFLENEKLVFAKKNRKAKFALNGAIYIHDRKTLFSSKSYPVGKKCVLFEINQKNSIDIDTEQDFEIAEKMAKKRKK